VRALLAQVRVELLLAARRGESVLVTLVLPLALLVFFASALPASIAGGNTLDFLVPGILALAVVSTSMVSLGITTAFERYYGVLKRLIGSPLPRSMLLLAKTLSILLIELFQAATVIGIARFGYGWEPRGSLALAGAALLLGTLAFAGIGLLMAGTLRAEATLAGANGLYVVFLLLGGFLFPLERLPPAVAIFARALPAGALADATRGALNGASQDLVRPFGVLAVWAAGAAGAAAMTFRAE
jgi:ABC-2 type transport system permease protein